MKYKVVRLARHFPMPEKGSCGQCPSLTACVHDSSSEIDAKRLHPAVLVLPGGGYALRAFK